MMCVCVYIYTHACTCVLMCINILYICISILLSLNTILYRYSLSAVLPHPLFVLFFLKDTFNTYLYIYRFDFKSVLDFLISFLPVLLLYLGSLHFEFVYRQGISLQSTGADR